MYDFWRDNFLDYISPLDEKFFSGKLGLDAGCGFGRHIYWAGKFGAEMVGIDLSEAVESAYKNTQELDNVHIVQASIYNLPFKEEIFDFCYSIGVIHHLPEPEKGFRELKKFVKKGGTISIWMYGKRKGFDHKVSVILRKITPKINHTLLYFVCVAIALFLRIFSHYPVKILNKLGLHKLIKFFPIRFHSDYPFYVVIGDAFDRLSVPLVNYYTRDELYKWFSSINLKDIKIIEREANNTSWRCLGIV